MSYQVLARKWRPRVFREMIGQEHVMRALINALDHDRLHHAYLFTGTRGVGKTSIARILAKCLNCEVGVSSEPCGECSACQEISQGRFVDLIEVDAASRTKIDDTRELLDNVQYAPARGRFKIYLIDEVHMLSNSSFNALLKTLEEPPAHVKFLLATTDPQKLPITVLSRCLQFNLKNLSAEKIVGHLQDILEKESIPSQESALWLLARSADGSMRDALSLTDQGISFGGGKISEPEIAAMLGTIDHRLIEKLITGLIEQNGATLLDAVEQFAQHTPDFDIAMADLITLLHRIAIAQAMPDALDNSYGDRQQILEFAAKLAPEDVQMFYQIALIGRRDLALSPSRRAGFEMTLLRMLAFKPQGVADVPTQKLGALPSSPQIPESNTLTELAETRGNHSSESVGNEVVDTEKKHQAQTEPSHSGLIQLPEAESKPDFTSAQEKQAFLRDQVKNLTGKEGFSAKSVGGAIHHETNERDQRQNEHVTHETDGQPSATFESGSELAREVNPRQNENQFTLDELTPESWAKIYPHLNIKGLIQSTASNTLFIGREDNHLDFALDEKKASLFDPGHAERLSAYLSDYFHESVRATIHLSALPESTETPAMYALRVIKDKKANAVASLYADPVVQSLQTEFAALLNEETVEPK